MPAESQPKNSRTKLAAYAVAFATAVGGSSTSNATELQAIQKIERYCTTSWRNAGISQQDWSDCTQQALAELLERVSRAQLAEAIDNAESAERRELNRTVWRMAKRWQRGTRWHSLDESLTPQSLETPAESDPWDQVASVGRQCLNPRQQRILSLTREGWRVAEIAQELSLSSARVSDEKYKAIAKVREHLGFA